MAERVELVDLLQAGMTATRLRGKVIANNIANVGTPGYRRQEVAFESALAEAMRGGGVTRRALAQAAPQVVQASGGAMLDADGNDMTLDVEIGEMIKNSAMSKTYLRLLAKTYRQMEQAMGVE